MAGEITISGALNYSKAGTTSAAVSRSVTGALFTVTTQKYIEGTMSVPNSATAIPLGGVTAPHWAFFINQDATNSIYIRNGVSGADMIELGPGESSPAVPLRSTSTPYAITSAGTCVMEYLIVNL